MLVYHINYVGESKVVCNSYSHVLLFMSYHFLQLNVDEPDDDTIHD